MKSSYSKKRVPSKAKGKKAYKKKYTPRKGVYKRARMAFKKMYENTCGRHYLVAVTSPFSPAARGACVPTAPCPDSHKTSAKILVTATVGPDGIIQAVIAPCMARDKPSLYVYSDHDSGGGKINIYTPNATTQSSALTAGWSAYRAITLPYSSSELLPGAGTTSSSVTQPDVIGRVVACGVRVRYTGRADHMAGMMTGYVSPDHCNLENQQWSDIALRSSTRRKNLDKGGMQINMCAVMSNEYEYANNLRNNQNGSYEFGYYYPYCQYTIEQYQLDGGVIGGILCEGLIENSSVEIEVITHCEYIGPLVSGTKNITDKTSLDTATRVTTDTPVVEPHELKKSRYDSNLFINNVLIYSQILVGLIPTHGVKLLLVEDPIRL